MPPSTVKAARGSAVTQTGSEWSILLPALNTGGLYKTHHQQGRTVL